VGEHLKRIAQIVREVLEKGLKVVVIGWRTSNHDKRSCSYPKDKVVFIELGKGRTVTVPSLVGVILFTRFKNHHMRGIPHGVPDFVFRGTNQIKQVLAKSADLLTQLTPSRKEESAEMPKPTAIPEALAAPAPEVPTPNGPGPRLNLNDKDKVGLFCEKFTQASKSSSGKVSKTKLGEITRSTFDIMDSATPALIRAGLVVAEKSEGQKVGWYLPGPAMLEILTASATEDPTTRVKKGFESAIAELKHKLESAKASEKVAQLAHEEATKAVSKVQEELTRLHLSLKALSE